jgi:hypothetical protein
MHNLIRRAALVMFVATMIASCAGHGAQPPAPTPSRSPAVSAGTPPPVRFGP